MEIQGKSALVTGAGSGICRAISLALANAGASVVVADVDHVGGLETVRLIQEKAGNAMFIGADVSIELAKLNNVDPTPVEVIENWETWSEISGSRERLDQNIHERTVKWFNWMDSPTGFIVTVGVYF